MCYDIKTSLEAQLTRAQRSNDLQAIEEITEQLLPLTDLPIYHASGFEHPQLLIYTERSGAFPEIATWGLIPHWVKEYASGRKLWNKTLNARGETLFEKPSFKRAAIHHRCIIYIDGFYEHHHFEGKVYPYFIHSVQNEALALAGLYSDWQDPETGGTITTFTIVTTIGNSLMKQIHNNPKLKGPRMPLLLPRALEDQWLAPINDQLDNKAIKDLIQKYPEDQLQAHTVLPLRGKNYRGNIEGISDHHPYEANIMHKLN